LAEGKHDRAATLTSNVLHVDQGNTQARRLLERALSSCTKETDDDIVSRSMCGGFFLQRLRMADSLTSRLDLFLPLVKGKKVLHVGCVDSPIFDPNNNLHLILASHASELHGLDIDTAGLVELQKHFNGAYFDSVDACLQNGTHYDLVLVPETIEHVPNAESFLKDIDRVPCDSIAITAPCIYGWWQYGVMSHKEKGQSFGPYGWLLNPGSFVEEVHPDHKYWFSPYTLTNLVESATPWQIQSVQLLENGRQICVVAQRRPKERTVSALAAGCLTHPIDEVATAAGGTKPSVTAMSASELIQAGKQPEAVKLLASALVNGETSELWNDWATAQCSCGNVDRAEWGYRRALRLVPSNRQAAVNLGFLLFAQGQLGEGIPLLEQHRNSLTEQEKQAIQELVIRFQGGGVEVGREAR